MNKEHAELVERLRLNCEQLAAHAERLSIENIQLKFACGYPMPSELEAHILPANPFQCGTCDAKAQAIERLSKDSERLAEALDNIFGVIGGSNWQAAISTARTALQLHKGE